EQIFPSGHAATSTYDLENPDTLQQGNLLTLTHTPAPHTRGHETPLTARFAYEPLFQFLTSKIDTRGQELRLRYDARGNLTEKIYPRTTVNDLKRDSSGSFQPRIVQSVERSEYNQFGQLVRFIDAEQRITDYFYYPQGDYSGTSRDVNVIK